MTEKQLMSKRFHYSAKLVKVIDGDTIDVLVDLGFEIKMKMRLRLSRIDTPEIRGKERALGLKAKRELKNYLSKDLIISTEKRGKFGRYLAEVWSINTGTWINVNDWLLTSKLAKPYKK